LRARKERLPNEQAEHQAVLDALQAGDGPALDVALRRHLARSLDDAAGDLRKVEPNQERNGQKREDNDEKLARMILVAGVVLLAPTYDAAGQGAPPTIIRMWTFLNLAGTSPREVALADIIASFERANPEIKVSVEPQIGAQASRNSWRQYTQAPHLTSLGRSPTCWVKPRDQASWPISGHCSSTAGPTHSAPATRMRIGTPVERVQSSIARYYRATTSASYTGATSYRRLHQSDDSEYLACASPQ
jgi:hypothetical protein